MACRRRRQLSLAGRPINVFSFADFCRIKNTPCLFFIGFWHCMAELFNTFLHIISLNKKLCIYFNALLHYKFIFFFLFFFSLQSDHSGRHAPNNVDQLALKYMVRSAGTISSPYWECFSLLSIEKKKSKSLEFNSCFSLTYKCGLEWPLFSARRCVK